MVNSKMNCSVLKEVWLNLLIILDGTRERLIDETIHIATEKNDVPVEIAMCYNNSFTENIHSYVNNINTIEGGTHMTGFRRG
jgi:DNA gyrase subunit B